MPLIQFQMTPDTRSDFKASPIWSQNISDMLQAEGINCKVMSEHDKGIITIEYDTPDSPAVLSKEQINTVKTLIHSMPQFISDVP